MSNRYVLKFSKDGYVKYTSHLDMLRLFKRSFRKTGITLKYSQGFNPHPKMGFAQPLSLGYSSKCELIEFETVDSYKTEEIIKLLINEMPEGIKILSCSTMPGEIKSLAADAKSAEYKILMPISLSQEELNRLAKEYLQQDEIVTLKRMKKTKEMAPVNIKDKIISFNITKAGDYALFTTLLDCGSTSNCSPELVINSFVSFAGLDLNRYDIEVERSKLYFSNNLQF